jgi:type III secretory pathway component EscR
LIPKAAQTPFKVFFQQLVTKLWNNLVESQPDAILILLPAYTGPAPFTILLL